MKKRYEIRLAGRGGQGMILAGRILAEAAATYDSKNAAQTQSYGAEARGGASRAEVVISEEEIDYPKVITADLLLAMSQEAYDKYSCDLKEEGTLIVDSVNVKEVTTEKAYRLPITKIAEEATGQRITANMVGLGLLVGLSGAVSDKAIEAAVKALSPASMKEANLKALKTGLKRARRGV
ncbi:MAG: 2-oxoacid:acceptor oxidoreductase family protein [Chloroflexota bacterium]|nr:2-oxoacid:acceptor oxidoreductase family protein [Chloroflexota bacterium]